MRYKLTRTPQPHDTISVRDLEIGDVAQIADGELYAGQIILKTYSSIVSLSDPTSTWTDREVDFSVVILPLGTTITLTVTAKEED